MIFKIIKNNQDDIRANSLGNKIYNKLAKEHPTCLE